MPDRTDTLQMPIPTTSPDLDLTISLGANDHPRRLRAADWHLTEGRQVNAALLFARYLPSPYLLDRTLQDHQQNYQPPFIDDATGSIRTKMLHGWIQRANSVQNSEGSKASRERYLSCGDAQYQCDLLTSTRLSIGGSMTNPYGISIDMHPFYSYPIIPGSGVRGAIRAAVEPYIQDTDKVEDLVKWINDAAGTKMEVDTPDTNAKEFLVGIFGPQPDDQQDAGCGRVTVLGGVPTLGNDNAVPVYELDVTTPLTPTPKPVTYPVVRKGVAFSFALALNPAADTLTMESEKCQAYLEVAKNLLLYTLTTTGVGSKTGAGYGLFERPKSK